MKKEYIQNYKSTTIKMKVLISDATAKVYAEKGYCAEFLDALKNDKMAGTINQYSITKEELYKIAENINAEINLFKKRKGRDYNYITIEYDTILKLQQNK